MTAASTTLTPPLDPSTSSTPSSSTPSPNPVSTVLEQASALTADAASAAGDVAKTVADASKGDQSALEQDIAKLRSDFETLKADGAHVRSIVDEVRALPGKFAELVAEFRVLATRTHRRALLGSAIGSAVLTLAMHHEAAILQWASSFMGAGCSPAQEQHIVAAGEAAAREVLPIEQAACCAANIVKPTSTIAGLCRLAEPQVERFRQELEAAKVDAAAFDYADANASEAGK